MRHLLEDLYKARLQLIAVVLTVIGALLMIAARSVASDWLTVVPLDEIGSAMFTTGLLAVAFEYIDRKDGDRRAMQRLRSTLREEAPAIRDAVLEGFASSPEALSNVASPQTIDRIATNALALRLGDPALAADVYGDIRKQVIRAPERWRDVRVSVVLSPADADLAGANALFVATVRWEYRVRPATSVMRFACVSDLDEYRELLLDPTITSPWYFEPLADLDASSRKAYELLQFTVDGQYRPVRRTQRKGAQLYTASIAHDGESQDEVLVSYTYRVLVQQAGHLLYLDVSRPTKGLHVQFWYGDTGIRFVNALDFIASAEQPRVVRAPRSVPTPAIDIGFDGWVFPRSGVAFVWVLDAEMQSPVAARRAVQEG